ncbi:hypothetical protein I6F26_22030 [Ensifer sp. IC3342]|nr:hypothetical protein [Ensifer sp. BRP08]MCA1449260.1 hypothetical protein [Ensifer sp. IC3342]
MESPVAIRPFERPPAIPSSGKQRREPASAGHSLATRRRARHAASAISGEGLTDRIAARPSGAADKLMTEKHRASQLKQFEIYLDDVLIGMTSFERGDAPMGVAFGELTPTPSYRREQITEASILTAKLGGKSIPSNSGVIIEDYSEEEGEIQVTIVGIDHQLYEELFPQHVAAYEARYSR